MYEKPDTLCFVLGIYITLFYFLFVTLFNPLGIFSHCRIKIVVNISAKYEF